MWQCAWLSTTCMLTMCTHGLTVKLFYISGVHVVTFEGWKRIDAEETKRGVALGKPREKITDIREMLEIAVN